MTRDDNPECTLGTNTLAPVVDGHDRGRGSYKDGADADGADADGVDADGIDTDGIGEKNSRVLSKGDAASKNDAGVTNCSHVLWRDML